MKKTRSNAGAASHVRCADYAERLTGVHFPPEVWAVFAHLEQPRSTEELAARLKLDKDVVASALRRLARRKLVKKHELRWQDYEAALVASAPAPSDTAAPPETPASLPERSDLKPEAELRLRWVNARRRSPSPPPDEIRVRLKRDGAPPRLRLKRIIGAIAEKAGGGVPGQLLVYRVFLRVPSALMNENGIHSINEVREDLEITDPRLVKALAEACAELVRLPLETLAA